MKNQELAKIFNDMANYLEMDDASFRSNAYRKVSIVLETLEDDVKDIYDREGLKGLDQIQGVGKNIAFRIEEYLKTGKIKAYEKLKKETPVKLSELIAVEGMGVKKVKVLYQKLKVKNLKDLERVAKRHKIASLEGFGEKTEKNILQGITFLKRSKGRFLLGEIMPTVNEILERLAGLKEVEKISIAGSVRRKKETVGDVDILVVSKKPEKIMAFFVSLPEVVKVWSRGLTKSSVRVRLGVDIDLRVVPAKSYGSALQYFTGSKEHNIVTRRIAISKKLKLNEYGVFQALPAGRQGSKMIAGKNEAEVYRAIGLDFIAPEMRENEGEVELALRQPQGKLKKLPHIIGYDDIKGDLHCHSNWNGGKHSIETIAKIAIKMGYQYIGISDHTKFLKIEKGLNEKQLLKQKKEIEKLNKKLDIKILWGCESNIMSDGSIDISDEVLKQMDYVIAGVHSSMKMDKDKMMQRITTAMKNPHVDIIAHPTGRILQRRDEYQIDFDEILKIAKKFNVVLEINSSPDRLDLKDVNIRKAKKMGVKMIINTDAHHIGHLNNIGFGIAQARRGWAEKKDIINSQPLSKLLKYFK